MSALIPCRLFELRTKERELISEISGGQGQNKNLASRIAALDEQASAAGKPDRWW